MHQIAAQQSLLMTTVTPSGLLRGVLSAQRGRMGDAYRSRSRRSFLLHVFFVSGGTLWRGGGGAGDDLMPADRLEPQARRSNAGEDFPQVPLRLDGTRFSLLLSMLSDTSQRRLVVPTCLGPSIFPPRNNPQVSLLHGLCTRHGLLDS